MKNEFSIPLLTEMGIDVYVLRTPQEAAIPTSTEYLSKLLVVVESAANLQSTLLKSLECTLRIMDMSAEVHTIDSLDENLLANAQGFIVCGKSLVHAIGAKVPAQRQQELSMVTTGSLMELQHSALAKRALWGEIKRLQRELARPH